MALFETPIVSTRMLSILDIHFKNPPALSIHLISCVLFVLNFMLDSNYEYTDKVEGCLCFLSHPFPFGFCTCMFSVCEGENCLSILKCSCLGN